MTSHDLPTTDPSARPAQAAGDGGSLATVRGGPRPPPARAYRVTVVEGPNRGRVLRIDRASPGRLHVGTSRAAALVLDDRRVSRRHLALSLGGGGLVVEDLGSTNGTTCGGLAVERVTIAGSEVLLLGDCALRVEPDVDADVPVEARLAWGPLVGASAAMRRLYGTFDRLARESAPALLEGERGTGKALLAEALHAAGPRREGPFVVLPTYGLDDAALATALEAAAAEATGGSLYVDEVAHLGPVGQAALLRAAARAPAAARVRVIAGTRRDLDAEVERGAFLEPLLDALVGGRVELPPLAARRSDVPLLVEHVARTAGRSGADLPPAAAAAWNRRAWPGNVGELRAEVLRVLALGEARAQARDAAAPAPPDPAELGVETDYRDLLLALPPFRDARQALLDRFASAYVTCAVAAHGGNAARAAAASGLAGRYFNVLRARARDGGKEPR